MKHLLLTLPLLLSFQAFAFSKGESVTCRNQGNGERFLIAFSSPSTATVSIEGRAELEGDEIIFYPAESVQVRTNESGNYQLDLWNFSRSLVLERLEFPAYIDLGGDGYGTHINGALSASVFCF